MMIGQRAHLGDKQMDTRPTCLTMLRYRVNDHKFRGRCFQIKQNGLSTWLTSVWGAYARYSTAGWGRVSQSYAPAPRLHPGWAMVRPFYSGVWTRLLLGTPLILTKLHSLYIIQNANTDATMCQQQRRTPREPPSAAWQAGSLL